MIDSSGRRGLRANGTLFDILPIGQTISVAGGLLVLLLALVRPEASNGLEFSGRLLFWTLHVGLGLASLWLVGRWLAAGHWLPSNILLAVLLTGVASAILATPGYWLLDLIYSPFITDLDPEPKIDNLLLTLGQELMELGPWFIAAWLLLNLPVLLPPSMPAVSQADDVGSVEHSNTRTPQSQKNMLKISPDITAQNTTTPTSKSDNYRSTVSVRNDQKFLNSLPGIIGVDVVAVASDLHYLNVWTVSGRTTVLGNLRDVVAELGDRGMQVHRSHWVAHAHVRRIVGTAGDTACILSNELRVPISRRRWKNVREYYGRGVVHSTSVD